MIGQDNHEGPGHDEWPVCLHCVQRVDPLAKVCPHCGEAVGQLTPYLPFESIRWQAGIWGRMWHQVWRRDISLGGRVLRFCVIVWFVPILLLALFPIVWQKRRKTR